jgi:hypothetical protein
MELELMSRFMTVNTTATSMTWEVSFDNFITDIPEGEQAVFSFALYSAGFNGYDALSHSFNVSLPREASTTTSTTQTEIVTATTTPTDSSAGSDKKEPAGLSSAAVAGISLAATFGGLLLIVGGIFLGWKLIKARDSGARYQPGRQEPAPEESKPEPVQYPPAGRPASQTYQQYSTYHTSANEPWRTSLPTSVGGSSYGSGALYGDEIGYDQAYGHHYDPTTNYYPTPNQAHPYYAGYSRG